METKENKYQYGRIYKIFSNQTDKMYIGSTTERTLARRMGKHRSAYRRWLAEKRHYISSFDIIQYDDAKILLIETFPCKSKDELRAREQYWIKQFDCVNKYSALGRDEEKREEYQRNYRKEYNQKTVICECGTKSNKNNISHHWKTQKHYDLLFQQEAARFRSINVSNKFIKHKTIEQLNKNDLFVD